MGRPKLVAIHRSGLIVIDSERAIAITRNDGFNRLGPSLVKSGTYGVEFGEETE